MKAGPAIDGSLDQPIDLGLPIQRALLTSGAHPIPKDAVHVLAPATLYIREWQEYWLELPGVDHLRIGDRLESPKHGHWFYLRFENQLGLARLQAVEDNLAVGPSVTVEVISGKFPTLASHLTFYQNLLNDLFQRAVRMPFDLQTDTRRGVKETVQPPTPLFTFHFLRHVAKELTNALDVILTAPHRVLSDEEDLVRLAAVQEVDADMITDFFRNPSHWVKTDSHPLSKKLGGYVPGLFQQRLPQESFDTPENRFILHFLHTLLSAIDTLTFQPWWSGLSMQCEQILELRSQLRQAIVHPLFDDVGEQHVLPLNSQVLLRRDGYRQMLLLWQQFQQARRPFFQPLQEAIDVRNIAALYEYWVFFALAERIVDELGISPKYRIQTSDELGLNWTSQADFDNQGCLVFNREFTRRQRAFQSYSTPMRPDFTWVVGNQPFMIFDAKFSYQVGKFGKHIPALDNLYKMHTYRDALKLRSAVIIYPGNMDLFFEQDQRPHWVKQFTVGQLLRGELSGIGALAMQPGSIEHSS